MAVRDVGLEAVHGEAGFRDVVVRAVVRVPCVLVRDVARALVVRDGRCLRGEVGVRDAMVRDVVRVPCVLVRDAVRDLVVGDECRVVCVAGFRGDVVWVVARAVPAVVRDAVHDLAVRGAVVRDAWETEGAVVLEDVRGSVVRGEHGVVLVALCCDDVRRVVVRVVRTVVRDAVRDLLARVVVVHV